MSAQIKLLLAKGASGVATVAPAPAPSPTPTPTPTLNALSLSQTSFTIGTPASGTILGATTGSTIGATGLPTGFTINGAARTWSYDGTGSAGTVSPTFTETLAGATNTPRQTVIGITYNAVVAGLYTFDQTQLQASDQTVYNNILSKTSTVAVAAYPATFDRTVTVTSAAALQTAARDAYNNFKSVWTDIVCETGGDWSTDVGIMSSGAQVPVAMTGGIRIRKGDTDPNITGRLFLGGANNLHVEGLRFTRAHVSGSPDTSDSSCISITKSGDNGGLSPENRFVSHTVRIASCRFGIRFDPAKDALTESSMLRGITIGGALGIIIENCEFHGCYRGIVMDRGYKARIWNNRFQYIVLNPVSLSATGIQDGLKTVTGIHPEDACYYDVYNNLVLPPPDNLDGSVQGDAPHIDWDQYILYDGGTPNNPDPNHYSNHTPAVAHCYVLDRVNFILCDNESFYLVGGSKKGAIINGFINSDYSGGSPITYVMVGNIGATNGFSIQNGANSLTIFAFNTWGAPPATRPGPADSNSNSFAKATNYGTVRPGFSPTFRAYSNITHGIGVANDGTLVGGLPANIDINAQPGTVAPNRPQDQLNGTWENTSHDAGWWQNKIAWETMTTDQIKAALFAGWTPKTGVNAGAKITAPV